MSPRLYALGGRIVSPEALPALAEHGALLRAELTREGRLDPEAHSLVTALLGDISSLTLDLAKSWHCIHFIMSGSPCSIDSGLGLAILGQETYLEKVDLQIGLLSPSDVDLVADELSRADFQSLELSRRDTEATGVYRWAKGPKPDLVSACEAVSTYYLEAARQERAMFMWRA